VKPKQRNRSYIVAESLKSRNRNISNEVQENERQGPPTSQSYSQKNIRCLNRLGMTPICPKLIDPVRDNQIRK
jgi:hypothetical protein